jgi:RNA polymerase sigma factor (sigma-70 family)
MTDEDALVGRCLNGDSEAFRPLVVKHQRVVFSVAFRMLGIRADAEDVAQQAFADAYAALDRFRSEGRKNAFSTWVIRIAINRCKDILKSKKRTEEPLDAEVASREAMFAHDTRESGVAPGAGPRPPGAGTGSGEGPRQVPRGAGSQGCRGAVLRGDSQYSWAAHHHFEDQGRPRPAMLRELIEGEKP